MCTSIYPSLKGDSVRFRIADLGLRIWEGMDTGLEYPARRARREVGRDGDVPGTPGRLEVEGNEDLSTEVETWIMIREKLVFDRGR